MYCMLSTFKSTISANNWLSCIKSCVRYGIFSAVILLVAVLYKSLFIIIIIINITLFFLLIFTSKMNASDCTPHKMKQLHVDLAAIFFSGGVLGILT